MDQPSQLKNNWTYLQVEQFRNPVVSVTSRSLPYQLEQLHDSDQIMTAHHDQ